MDSFVDYYKLLEIEFDCSIQDIRKAYIRLAKIYHPDQGGNIKLFQDITKAYEILSNKELKKNYDTNYLQKSLDDNNEEEDYFKLKSQHKDYTDTSFKQLTQDEIKNLYEKTFVDKLTDEKMDNAKLSNRINNFQLERQIFDAELDEIYENTKFNNEDELNDAFDYIKKNNSQLTTYENFEGIDKLNGYFNGSSFLDDNINSSTALYSSFNDAEFEDTVMKYDNIKNIDKNDLDVWKTQKVKAKTLQNNEITDYFNKRKEEEELLKQTIKNNLKDNLKETENFLKIKDIQDYKNKDYF